MLKHKVVSFDPVRRKLDKLVRELPQFSAPLLAPFHDPHTQLFDSFTKVDNRLLGQLIGAVPKLIKRPGLSIEPEVSLNIDPILTGTFGHIRMLEFLDLYSPHVLVWTRLYIREQMVGARDEVKLYGHAEAAIFSSAYHPVDSAAMFNELGVNQVKTGPNALTLCGIEGQNNRSFGGHALNFECPLPNAPTLDALRHHYHTSLFPYSKTVSPDNGMASLPDDDGPLPEQTVIIDLNEVAKGVLPKSTLPVLPIVDADNLERQARQSLLYPQVLRVQVVDQVGKLDNWRNFPDLESFGKLKRNVTGLIRLELVLRAAHSRANKIAALIQQTFPSSTTPSIHIGFAGPLSGSHGIFKGPELEIARWMVAMNSKR